MKHYLIMDGGEDLSIKNTINSIVSRQRRLNLNLSELIEMIQKDPAIWEFSQLLKEEVDKKDADYSLTLN